LIAWCNAVSLLIQLHSTLLAFALAQDRQYAAEPSRTTGWNFLMNLEFCANYLWFSQVHIPTVLRQLSSDEIMVILKYITEWNTNSRNRFQCACGLFSLKLLT
jgi:hypothetical protein